TPHTPPRDNAHQRSPHSEESPTSTPLGIPGPSLAAPSTAQSAGSSPPSSPAPASCPPLRRTTPNSRAACSYRDYFHHDCLDLVEHATAGPVARTSSRRPARLAQSRPLRGSSAPASERSPAIHRAAPPGFSPRVFSH